jgi:2-amino-4-hydroxy-6-hydroxymethyldihydropteridine diphosphokinase
MPRAFIAFGGNVGDVRHTFNEAIAMLCDGQHVNLVARSSDYRTPPWGRTDQPDFINAVIAVRTTLSPQELLGRAQEIEYRLGRARVFGDRWGPRTLDIDIIDYDGILLDDPILTLPHPRLFERAFVLVPLAEIAPDAMIGGRSLAEALKGLDPAGIEKLP